MVPVNGMIASILLSGVSDERPVLTSEMTSCIFLFSSFRAVLYAR